MMIVVALTITIVASVPRSASAASAATSPVIAQCARTGTVSTTAFTAEQLEYAIAHLPVILVYSACPNAIQRALNAVIARARVTRHAVSHSASHGEDSTIAPFVPTWLIVVFALMLMGGAGASLVARRRHRDGDARCDQ
jgi:hypothetical protein